MKIIHTNTIAKFVLEVQALIDQQDGQLRTLAQAVLDFHNSYSRDVPPAQYLECTCKACKLAREVLK